MIVRYLVLLYIITLFISCDSKKRQEERVKGEIVAFIDDKPILIQEIDYSVQQQLYEQLQRIYMIRKIALDQKINDLVINYETQKLNLSAESYLNQYYQKKLSKKYIKIQRQKLISDKLPELKRTLSYHDINSEKGQDLFLKGLKRSLLEKLLDSLKTKHNIQVKLKPPLPPKISLNQIQTFYRGNLKSGITLLEVSDMECDRCREYYPVYKEIYQKYKDKVKFGFAHFSSYPTLSAIATNCAAKQGKFWEMHDAIMNKPTLLDTSEIYYIADELELNIQKFKQDFNSPEIPNNIEYNSKLIKQYGLFGTPTILINGSPVFDSSSKEDIEEMIEHELEKN
ncbi:MAG: thioredoxin domain-containing protein [Bacteroidales bacterium]|nr:thioredoxin domain-containing protein [Bacteroidales bacterium]